MTSPQTYKEFYPTTRSILPQQASFEFLEDSDDNDSADNDISDWFQQYVQNMQEIMILISFQF